MFLFRDKNGPCIVRSFYWWVHAKPKLDISRSKCFEFVCHWRGTIGRFISRWNEVFFLFISDDSISWPVKKPKKRVGGYHTRSETVEIVCSTLILSKCSLSAGILVLSPTSTKEDMRLSLLSPPRMTVLMPVIVARGIWGKWWSISSLSDWSIFRRHADAFFLLMYQCRLRIRSLHRRDSCVTKKERNAERETMMTAVQASTCCQNIAHTMSVAWSGRRIDEMRTIAMIIMKIERHRVVPKMSFWRRLIWMRHSRWKGIINTKIKAGKFDGK